jgi:hypothetical protein
MVKNDHHQQQDSDRCKELYREGLTAKMVRNVIPEGYEDELDGFPKASDLYALFGVLTAIKKKYDNLNLIQ